MGMSGSCLKTDTVDVNSALTFRNGVYILCEEDLGRQKAPVQLLGFQTVCVLSAVSMV